jgi:hypothetical protein
MDRDETTTKEIFDAKYSKLQETESGKHFGPVYEFNALDFRAVKVCPRFKSL